MYCGFCGSNKHEIENCPKTWGGQMNRRFMRCGFCGSRKHNIKACPKTWDGNAARTWHKETIKKDYIKD